MRFLGAVRKVDVQYPLYFDGVSRNIVELRGVPEPEEDAVRTAGVYIDAHQVTSRITDVTASQKIQIMLDICLVYE